MTKKSAARQERDAAKKQLAGNTCWDELNTIYESTRVMLYQHTCIHTLATNAPLLACLENPESTRQSITILARDLRSLNEQLNTIRNKHIGKSGGSSDPDVVWQSIMIGQEYSQLMELHTSVVQPTSFKILEDFQYAEKKLSSLAVDAVNAVDAAQTTQLPTTTTDQPV